MPFGISAGPASGGVRNPLPEGRPPMTQVGDPPIPDGPISHYDFTPRIGGGQLCESL
jgi:hypothetical protein